MAAENVEQLVDEDRFELRRGKADVASRQNHSVASAVGGVAFFLPGRLDQQDVGRQRQVEFGKPLGDARDDRFQLRAIFVAPRDHLFGGQSHEVIGRHVVVRLES